ncbi:MAG: hypothetical protein QOG94_1708 [Solirubrobacteraceae bacterium]|jgi:hypothetical protein|nr:hypothetical protein [Solirubrobacteraceae bacterium]MEA2138815.1 hypothetical protein [Solirubrobacteraceae bacterium]
MFNRELLVVAGASMVVATLAACGGGGGGGARAASTAASGAGGGLPQGAEPSHLDPKDFTTKIDNPYLTLRPGSRWVYRETDTTGARQRVVVTVTKRTKRAADGVTARVVRDVATEHGRVTEATDDWYAQDSAGNVWYLGEATAEYRDGKVASRAGSFEAGVGGAQPGIAMPANPRPGVSYRQEYLKGKAEDRADIVTVGEERVQVPFGHFDKRVLMTRDLEPTEPLVQELKFYVPGPGLVLAVHTDGDGGRAELLSYHPGA